MIQRWTGLGIQASDTGGLVSYADHIAEVEKLTFERDSSREASQQFMRQWHAALADIERLNTCLTDANAALMEFEDSVEKLRGLLRGVRTNIAYAHRPENCGDHCRNNCRDCVLKNTLEDIDAALTN